MPAQRNLTLLTDLYQLTMAQSYFREQQLGDATFSLFIRSYPLDRGYFVSAGLCDVLDYLENFAFDPAAIEYLARQKQFSDEFLHYLADSASPATFGRFLKEKYFLKTNRSWKSPRRSFRPRSSRRSSSISSICKHYRY